MSKVNRNDAIYVLVELAGISLDHTHEGKAMKIWTEAERGRFLSGLHRTVGSKWAVLPTDKVEVMNGKAL